MIFESGYKITQGFGRENTSFKWRKYYAKFGLIGHEGLDVVYGKWEEIPKVLSTYDSIVVKVHNANTGAYGRYVTLWVPELNMAFQYCHLASVWVVQNQEIVKEQAIGVMGGSANGKEIGVAPHVHINGIPVDSKGYRNGDFRNGYGGNVDPEPYF